MEYRYLGNTGLPLSVFSLGAWRTFGQTVDDETTYAVMKTAYDGGINFFDGAETYGFGQAELAMQRAIERAGWQRDTYVISSKVSVGEYGKIYSQVPSRTGLSRKRVFEACHNALKRYQTDHIDLFFAHRPFPHTSLMDLLITMSALIEQGKICYWGTSEFAPEDLATLHELAGRHGLSPPVIEQTGYNLIGRWRMEGELPRVLDRYPIGVSTYVPLKSGLLTGKYNDGIPADSRGAANPQWAEQFGQDVMDKVRRLTALAEEWGMSMTHLALAWIVRNPHVTTCILGASATPSGPSPASMIR